MTLKRYTLVGHLDYAPPYRWDWMWTFLTKRCVTNVERVERVGVGADTYTRTLAVGAQRGCFRVVPSASAPQLAVWATAGLRSATAEVLACVRRIFDLGAEPGPISARLGALVPGGVVPRLPGCVSAFEFAVRAILEQQISTRAAITLTTRLVSTLGTPLDPADDALTHLFPTAQQIRDTPIETLRALGLPASRATALHTLASKVADGSLCLAPPADIEAGIKQLTTLPGIGPWTAGYIALRGWSAPDVFLEGDHAVGQHFPGLRPREIRTLAEQWRPYRSYALMQIWGKD